MLHVPRASTHFALLLKHEGALTEMPLRVPQAKIQDVENKLLHCKLCELLKFSVNMPQQMKIRGFTD